MIPKFEPGPGDFDDLLLIGFDKAHLEDQNHLDCIVHFFLYDYRFERVWKNPDSDIEKLAQYRAVLSPRHKSGLPRPRNSPISSFGSLIFILFAGPVKNFAASIRVFK